MARRRFPILGLIGGGFDIGRGYLSQSRLQQACDSGVLAARKRIGTEVAVSGEIPDDAAEAASASSTSTSTMGPTAPRTAPSR